MENMAINPNFWRGRRVFLTGHTGFKGGWLSLLLNYLGAEVHGYALAPPASPTFFDSVNLSANLSSDIRGNIGSIDNVEKALRAASPEIVLHLAAQSLVVESYANPLETYTTNIIGTANLLDAVRRVPTVCAIIVVTTDKCYQNQEWPFPYREIDKLGGHDPYSSSKACAEIVCSAYRDSYFSTPYNSLRVALATARAGNVIGGGDWASNRLIPDCVRAFTSRQPITLRNPSSIRPWQHVMEPLVGYLMLAEALMGGSAHDYACAWNFGPNPGDEASVAEVVSQAASYWSESADVRVESPKVHEANLLRLDISKAKQCLGWTPQWQLDRAIAETLSWYSAWHKKQDMHEFTMQQIVTYLSRLEVA